MHRLLLTLPFLIAAVLAIAAATLAAGALERLSAREVSRHLDADGIAFAQVDVNGLQVILTGTAPSEAQRFRALAAAGKAVDAARLVDELEVTAAQTAPAPRFGLEILRSADGVSLIGLVPAGTDRPSLK